MTCVVVQFMTHDVLAVRLGPGVWACAMADVVEPTDGAGGTKQAAWHVAACALQVIMQFVVVEVCARRIPSPANASLAKPATAITTNTTAKNRMAASTGFQLPPTL
ncbi:MAG: hypothetical protein ABSB77_18925 [Xanthobacteraceae bacterium]